MGGLTGATLPLEDASRLLGDSPALRRAAEAEGFLFFRALIPADFVRSLRDVVLSACRTRGFLAEDVPPGEAAACPGIRLGASDDPRWVSFLTDVLPRPEFAAVGRHASLRRVVEALLPAGFVEGRGDVCRLVSPDARDFTTAPHQDRFYVAGSGPLWVAWLPVVDCPRAVGPLAVLPRSHRAGLLPHPGEDSGRHGITVPEDAAFATDDLEPGDVLFFSGLTVHAALPNVSADRLRISADYRFEAAPA